jgi:hypothetical protein
MRRELVAAIVVGMVWVIFVPSTAWRLGIKYDIETSLESWLFAPAVRRNGAVGIQCLAVIIRRTAVISHHPCPTPMRLYTPPDGTYRRDDYGEYPRGRLRRVPPRQLRPGTRPEAAVGNLGVPVASQSWPVTASRLSLSCGCE